MSPSRSASMCYACCHERARRSRSLRSSEASARYLNEAEEKMGDGQVFTAASIKALIRGRFGSSLL